MLRAIAARRRRVWRGRRRAVGGRGWNQRGARVETRFDSGRSERGERGSKCLI
jgi:hypothetical protein